MKSISYQQALLKAIRKFFDKEFFAMLSGKNKSRWPARHLLLNTCLMCFIKGKFLKDSFSSSREVVISMFPQRKRPGKTYQGFVKARRMLTKKHGKYIMEHLRAKHKDIAGQYWQRDGFVAFAVDGTQLALPRTDANLEYFGSCGQQNSAPQMNLVTLYHLGTGLPWAWQQGTTKDGERTQLRQLIPTLPENSLLIADAGYTGFALFNELLSNKIDFLIRVGSNITLLDKLDGHIEKQGQELWFWPLDKRKEKPLRLRLIKLKSKAGSDVFLLTNIIDKERLSDKAAGKFYHMRWGVEIFYRDFKCTFDNHKLRSQSPAQAEDELFWAMISMLLLGLMSVMAIIEKGKDPLSLSVANALRLTREAMTSTKRWKRKADFSILLADALKDKYKRKRPKAKKDYPRKKQESPPKPPNIRTATEAEKQRFRRLSACA